MSARADLLMLPSPFSRRILWVDPMSGALMHELFAGEDDFAFSSFSTISTHRHDTLVLAGMTGGERALLRILSPRAADRMIAFDRDLDTFAQLPWPRDPSRFLVGGTSPTSNGEWQGVVAFNEPDRTRFLPGSWVIGDGIVSQFVTDEEDRVFALLPWVPALVRITPIDAVP